MLAVPSVVTINRADVIALIGEAAQKLTGGNKTEAVALAVRRLLDQEARKLSLFGANPGSVTVAEDIDPTEPVFQDGFDTETGAEIIASRPRGYS
jgi:hypothetical protein